MRNWQQMVSGDLQLAQAPVFVQGVESPKRCALIGAATLRARFTAPSTSPHTLFMPTMKMTFLGPCAMADTRLEFPLDLSTGETGLLSELFDNHPVGSNPFAEA